MFALVISLVRCLSGIEHWLRLEYMNRNLANENTLKQFDIIDGAPRTGTLDQCEFPHTTLLRDYTMSSGSISHTVILSVWSSPDLD